jgi:hypothetical protein
MKAATPQSLPDGDNSSAGMMVSTAATMKACSVAVRVSSGSASGAAADNVADAPADDAGWASAGIDRTVVSAAAVPTAPLRKSRRGMVSSAMKLLPRPVTGIDPGALDEPVPG